MSPVHGLLSVDVSTARARLVDGGSLTGFLVGAVARAAARHPEVHAYRGFRRNLIVPDRVDVAVIVEVDGHDGRFPLAHVVHDADERTIEDISSEIRAVKSNPKASPSGRLLNTISRLAARLPGAIRGFYWAAARSTSLRKMTGTVSVTSVGMFAGGSGFGIGPPTIMSLTVLIGGASMRPVVAGDEVTIREMLDVTVTVDHNVVDGAPVARFVADLRAQIESAAVLDSAPRPARR